MKWYELAIIGLIALGLGSVVVAKKEEEEISKVVVEETGVAPTEEEKAEAKKQISLFTSEQVWKTPTDVVGEVLAIPEDKFISYSGVQQEMIKDIAYYSVYKNKADSATIEYEKQYWLSGARRDATRLKARLADPLVPQGEKATIKEEFGSTINEMPKPKVSAVGKYSPNTCLCDGYLVTIEKAREMGADV